MLEKVRKARERKKYLKLPNRDVKDRREASLIEFEKWLTSPTKLLYSFIFGFLLTIIVYVAYTHSHVIFMNDFCFIYARTTLHFFLSIKSHQYTRKIK